MGCSYPVGKPPHRSGKEYESLIWLSSKPLYDSTSGGQTTKLENISAREIVFPKISTGQTTTRFYQFWSTFQHSVWRINCECFSDHARVGGLPRHVRQRLILLFEINVLIGIGCVLRCTALPSDSVLKRLTILMLFIDIKLFEDLIKANHWETDTKMNFSR